jgi:hypothetical protein
VSLGSILKRRLTILLVAWFALFSVAAPAVTCAAAAQQGNCCPDQPKPPCGECPNKSPQKATSDYCAVAPATVAQSTAAVDKFFAAQPDLVPASSIGPLPQAIEAPALARGRAPPALRDDPRELTYLVTGRLRL